MLILAVLLGAGYVAFRSPRVQTLITQWFMKQLSATYKAKITIEGVDISFFKSLVLDKVMIEDQNQDTLLYVDKATLQIDSLKFFERKVHFGSLDLRNSKTNILKDNKGYNFQFLLPSSSEKPDTIHPWAITFTSLYLRDSNIKYKDITAKDTILHGVNFNDLDIGKFNLSIVNIQSSDSLTKFYVDNFALHEKSGFNIGELRFNARIDSSGFKMSNFTLDLDHSHVTANQINVSNNRPALPDSIKNNQDLSILNQYAIDGIFKQSVVSLTDLAYLIPEIWGMNEPILFSGNIKGSLNNIKLKKLNLKIGKTTQMNADLELSGLPDWKHTFIYFKLYNNIINFNDLAAIRMPDSSPDRYLKFPPVLLNNLKLTYQGNFSGFPSDFVAYGTLGGDLGKLTTDIAIRPGKSGEMGFNGKLNAKSFQIGRLLDYEPLGAVSLGIKVNGSKSGDKKFNMKIEGNIDSLYLNNYRIDSIYVNGKASERSYEGEMTVEDNNLQMSFSGIADLSNKIPVFNFKSRVSKADLFALGLDKEFKDSRISFDHLESNFNGSNIDNLNGQINLNNFSLTRDNKTLLVKNLALKTTNSPEVNTIKINSDLADVNIEGKYLFREFDLTIRDYLKYYLPSAKLPFSQRPTTGKNSMNFDIRIKKAEELGGFILAGLSAKSPVVLKGNINSDKKTMNFDASANEILYNKTIIKGLTLNSRNVGNRWLVRAGTEEVLFGGTLKVQNLSINNSLAHDSLKTSLTWNNTGTPTYSGKIDAMGVFSVNKKGNNLADFYLNPTKIWVADSLWQIDQSQVHLDSTSISINNFNIHHNLEGFRVDGKGTENPSDKLNVVFNKVKLGNLDIFAGEDLEIDGILNGTATIADPYHQFYLTSDLKLSDFTYLGKNFGDILMENNWDKENKRLNSSLTLEKDGRSNFLLAGYYEPETDNLNFKSTFTDYPLETLLPLLTSFSNKIDGTGNGTVNVSGKLSFPSFKGKVAVRNALVGIDYTKIVYSLNDTVRFSGDSIIFKNITVHDNEKNTALYNGVLTHRLFGNMTYNMTATTNKILALNTNASDNNLFYGVAHVSGKITLVGAGEKLKMISTLKSESGTQINVPLENPESVTEYNFIRFVNPDTLYQKSQPTKRKRETNNFELDLNLITTPDAKIQLLFNSAIGDAITGQGNGNLRLVYDKESDFYIYGDYTFDKGDYMFVLQNVIDRKFKIDQGSTITWNGDVYGAVVDLNAVYTLRTSISDLLPTTTTQGDTRRIPVECRINLSKKLFNPTVKFDIAFPTADERTKDELQQFFSTQDDINRQMLSLMVMGQFFTPEYLKGRQDYQSSSSNLVGATASDVLSNKLSSMLSQLSNDFDIGLKYRPGDQVNPNNQMEVALSTQMFNNRVIINGNIGNNSRLQANTTNTANPVVGEVEVYVKLNKSGKLQLKAYNRANNDLIYDTSLYKQGLGIMFKEEFDSFSDLFKFYGKKKKKE